MKNKDREEGEDGEEGDVFEKMVCDEKEEGNVWISPAAHIQSNGLEPIHFDCFAAFFSQFNRRLFWIASVGFSLGTKKCKFRGIFLTWKVTT